VKHRKKIYNIYIYTSTSTRLKKIRSFGSLHFIHDVHYNVGRATPPPSSSDTYTSLFHGILPTYTVINLWLYRVEINKPRYVITYVRNEYGAEIRFSNTAYTLPGPLFRYFLNNNSADFVMKSETYRYLCTVRTIRICDIIMLNVYYYNYYIIVIIWLIYFQ
jgi:hypothetical protein